MLFPLPLCSPRDGFEGITQKGWWVTVYHSSEIRMWFWNCPSQHRVLTIYSTVSKTQPKWIWVCPSRHISRALQSITTMTCTKIKVVIERSSRQAFHSYTVVANPIRAASWCPGLAPGYPFLAPAAGQVLARGISSSNLWTHIPAPLTSRQASPDVASHPISW